MSRYVGLRTFALSSLPSWLSNRCHEIAREHFRAGTSGVDVREVMEFSLIKFEADPISRWIVKDLHHAKPALVRKHIKKELLRMADMIDPKFSEKRFQELGIPEAGVLSDLLSPRGEANSLESPQAFKPSTTELHRCIKESCFGEDSLEQLCEQMISFNPLRKGEMAVHANRAYTDIGEAIIRYTLLTDVLAHGSISLTSNKFQALFEELRIVEPSVWNTNPRMQGLLLYSKHLDTHPDLATHIAATRVFGHYAFNNISLEDFERDAARLKEQTERLAAAPHQDIERPANVEAVQVVDEMVHEIETLFSEYGVTPHEKGLVPLRLVRAALSSGTSVPQLERMLVDAEFEAAKVFAELRGRSGERERLAGQAHTERRSGWSLDAASSPRRKQFEILLHEKDGTSPFTEWYSDLDSSVKERVNISLMQFAQGHTGTARKLLPRHPSEREISVYELKLIRNGLRIYFRYLPNQRVVVLGGGGKSSQDRDIRLAFERARIYNGNGERLASTLKTLTAQRMDAEETK